MAKPKIITNGIVTVKFVEDDKIEVTDLQTGVRHEIFEENGEQIVESYYKSGQQIERATEIIEPGSVETGSAPVTPAAEPGSIETGSAAIAPAAVEPGSQETRKKLFGVLTSRGN